MSLGNTVLQLFCCYYSGCLYRWFQCWMCIIIIIIIIVVVIIIIIIIIVVVIT
jgi:hypothetical protein